MSDRISRKSTSPTKNIWRCLRQRDYPPDKDGWIDYHDLKLVARNLRNLELLDRDMRLGLADKLDPTGHKKSRYKLVRPAGRPQLTDPSDDPLVMAMNKGTLTVIAEHVRQNPLPDPRVRNWLADRFDPASPDGPRFIVKLPPGRPVGKSPLKELAERMLAHRIDSDFRAHGKLEAALHNVAQKTGVSRSTALRKWKKYS